ncbi:phage tail protein [Leisingera daeponensis]|uniref:Phage tail protein n=1 Tax=Leisingera daeponensis TaxID=405746 RepID=A0ABS7NJM7_9RHOB|nr:phage tail protein [Leisingera daeponensis]MBY6141116.1 phage tail protein [Leisingera daeponensis]
MAIFASITAAITAISSWTISLGALGTFAIGNFLLRAAVQLGVSALVKSFAKKGGPQEAPFAIQGTVRTGGSVPRSFVLGPSLSAGSLVWHSEWGEEGNTPNAYYTQVIALSDIPVAGLKRWFIEGRAVTLEDTGSEKGLAAVEYREDGKDHAWIRFHDGTQLVADEFLTLTVNDAAPRAYSSSRVGKGIAYAVVTFRVNNEIFTGFPRSKFVLDGVKLYDVSKDSTQGGTGPHRWDDPATWGGDGDALPAVQAYNLARGIYYRDPGTGGAAGETSTVDLGANQATLSLKIVGGGGGGVTAGTGGNTVVTLKDGASVVKSWTAAGGVSRGSATISGEVSEYPPHGNGAAGKAAVTEDGGHVQQPEIKGGGAGSLVVVADYDISGLADPKIEITIGAGAPGARAGYVQYAAGLASSAVEPQWFYGLQGLTAARLPAAHWVSQIGKCRAQVEGEDGLEPAYRCAGEITVNSEIGSAFEAVLTACAGRMSEVGGIFKIYVGAPDAPIAHFEDEDIVSLAPQTFTPFFGLSETVNGVIASYPSPDEGYVMRSTPPLYNAGFEVEDGGRRLMTDVQLSFVPFPAQAQRLLKGELAAARRARRHTHTLPARFRLIEPGDVVTWTSARNGYAAKQFRVDGIIDLPNCDLIADLTEVDPSDHGSWDHSKDYKPVTPVPLDPVRPTVQGVVGFNPVAADIQDAAGTARRPALLMQWNANVDDIAGIRFEVRLKETAAVVSKTDTRAFETGDLLIEAGLVGASEYEARAKYIPASPRRVSWTSWVPVSTNDVRFGKDDFGPGSLEWSALALEVRDQIDSAGDANLSAQVAADAQAAAEAAASGAQGSAAAAQASEAAASGAQAAASSSEAAALASQQAAEAAETAAAGSASAAASSASAASASETAAGSSASAAESSRLAAETAEGNAAGSASAAASSASAASASETAAGSSASAAETSRLAAETAEGNAAGSASAAASSASAASASETAAGSSASAAESSRIEAAIAGDRSFQHSAGNMLGRSRFAPGAFDPFSSDRNHIASVTGHPNGAAYALRATGRDVYSDGLTPEDLAGRSFRIRGVVDASASPYNANIGFRVIREDGSSHWITLRAADAGAGPQAFDETLSTPAYTNPQGFMFFLQSDGPGAASDHQIDWSELHYEDVTESTLSASSASAAASSASAASASETAAGSSASAAESSRLAAETAEGNAAGSASAAASSASAASASETAAGSSASAAESSRLAAETSEGNAAGSASAAASSASAASASETAAGSSASAAETSRLAAETSEGNAAGSASASASSASAASASETAAGSSASAAETSRLAAEAAEGNAAGSASAAASSASAASASETAAAQSASSASQSANSAGTAASGASASQSAAAQSATDAAGSASAAAQSATVASQTLTQFRLGHTDFQRILDGLSAVDDVGPAETASEGGDVLGQGGSVITATGGEINTSGSTSGLRIEIPAEQALQFSGRRIRVDVLAKQPSSSPAAKFAAAYSTSDTGNSGKQAFTLSSDWAWHSFHYNVPAATAGGSDFIGLWGDDAEGGKKTQFARVVARLAPLADDIPEIGIVQAEATAASQAITDLEGNAAASLVFRAKAGGATGAVEIVAADNAQGGSASKVKLTGDEIEFDGLSVFNNSLQSDDFQSGASGWRITKGGAAEFNQLIVRQSLVDGAASKGGVLTAQPSPVTKNHNNGLGALTLGKFEQTEFWQIAARLKYRKHSVQDATSYPQKGDPIYAHINNFTLPRLQWRIKSGGSWGTWITLYNFPQATTTSWLDESVVVSKQGVFDDVQIRIVISIISQHTTGSGATDATYTNVQETSYVARALVR